MSVLSSLQETSALSTQTWMHTMRSLPQAAQPFLSPSSQPHHQAPPHFKSPIPSPVEIGVAVVVQWLTNPTRNHEVCQFDPWPRSAGQGSGVAMSCGVGRRWGSGLTLLWLWRRQVVTAPIRPLAWELPDAECVAQKSKKKKKKENPIKIILTLVMFFIFSFFFFFFCFLGPHLQLWRFPG